MAGRKSVTTIPEDRPISRREADIVHWLVEHGADNSLLNLVSSIPRLRVVGRCSCGCASVDFEPGGQSAGSHPLAEASGATPDGTALGVILWGRADAITGLEVYDLGAPVTDLPELASLSAWHRK